MCAYQGALPSSRLRYLNKAVSLQIYKKYNWQRASAELATCTACVEGHRAGPRALLHALRHYGLQVKIILADFNQPRAKFNSPSNFPAIQYLQV